MSDLSLASAKSLLLAMTSVRSAPRLAAQLCSHTAQAQPLRSRPLSLLDHVPQAPHRRIDRVPCRHSRGRQQRSFASFATRQAEASTSPTPTSSTLPPSASSTTTSSSNSGTASLKTGFSDQPIKVTEDDPSQVDWASSFHGLSTEPFSKEAAEVLLKPIDPEDVEIKPDGIIYLPEIKYRRILNKAFGPGGWGLAPRGESIVTPKTVTREYALLAHGRLVSIARGEQDYFSPEGIPTAAEGCKSNAMVRCCKDIGIASELWDPRFIRKFKAEKTREVFVEHVMNKKKTKIWVRKGDPVAYPFKETKFGS